MLSARTIYGEIFDNDEAFGLFCSIAASGEAQGGWENGKIAALVPGSQAGLAAKIARHGADEDNHGRIFAALLRKRGLEPVAVPADTDDTVRLEAAGIGLAHTRLRRGEELTEAGIVACLAHSRVTEQRASEQMRALRRHAGDRPGIARAVRVISDDEDNHLACCHEELLRLATAGHAQVIRATLRAAAVMRQDQRGALEGPANPALVRPELRDGLRVLVERVAHVGLLSLSIPGCALGPAGGRPGGRSRQSGL
jgi:rubrerythrin